MFSVRCSVFFLSLALLGALHAKPIDVYFGGGGIYHAKFDTETGKLTEPKPAIEGSGAGFMAWDSSGTVMYAVTRVKGGQGVAGFHKQDDGSLIRITESKNPDGGAAHIAVYPSDSFLITAQYGGGSTALFPINEDRTLGECVVYEHEGGSKVVERRQDKPHPHWCGFSKDGNYALVPDLGTDSIHIYRVDGKTPALKPWGSVQGIPGGGPRHMRFSADNKFIYLLNELALSVTTFAYDAPSGTASEPLFTTKSLPDEVKAKEAFNSAAEILVHPNGRFVWSSNRGHDSITCYRAEPTTGQLTVTEVEAIRGAWPRNINIDPSGKWILAAGANSNTISVFKIDQVTGELQYQTKGTVNAPKPICILFAK